ncbi:hypothetical protein IFM89_002779 [Coptis chinensis]|uniref:YTH domain-containing family protein n=1 Tax=Coptis chinensis TaxID=261450 RepID=A0A835LUT0_9MAGN|nr:hypothetical protein IFM89_002779 [Coptis chinensis]
MVLLLIVVSNLIQNCPSSKSIYYSLFFTDVVIRRDNYNLPDFPTKYDHALFFVIKSYSEDDIHKSIKYNVWVNASGQFCGVAEMIGQVDFNKNMDFWQQDKWNGVFPIRFPQGMNMLNVFKNHLLKTSMLDDFTFYESRQKAMQDKRIRAPTPHLAPLQWLGSYIVLRGSSLSNNYYCSLYRYEIQLGMHDPYEDCVATMRLYKRMRAQNHPVEEFTTSTVAHSTRCSTIYDSLKPKELEGCARKTF